MRTLALLLVLCSTAFAAPPVVDIAPEIQATSEYVTVQPKTDAVAITYVAQSGVEPFPSVMLKDPRTFVLPTRGLAVGRYKFVAVASLDDEHTRVDFVVVVGNAPPVVVTPDTPVEPDKPAPVDPTTKPTAVVYVYEKDDGGVPSAVLAGLNRVNREQKIRATLFEDDSTDGTGDVPEQYKTPRAEALKVGLPALVVMAGYAVLRVVKAPTTEAAVVEAAR
jgi:hypothetical protein